MMRNFLIDKSNIIFLLLLPRNLNVELNLSPGFLAPGQPQPQKIV